MSTKIFEILDKQIRPKAFQQTLVEILRSHKTFSPDLINKIKSYYHEAEKISQIALESVHPEAEDSIVIACKKACIFCCHMKVMVTAPELIIVKEYITDTFSREKINTLLENLRDTISKTDRGSTVREKLAVPCGFLKNGIFCCIYEVRPFACRAFNSLDAKFCENYLENQDVEIPISMCHYAPFDAFKRGVIEAFKVAGIKNSSQELNVGVLGLLEN